MMRLLPILLMVGCVSKGQHELVQVQLDATRIALSARSAAANESAQEHEALVRDLIAEISLRQLQLDELSAREDLREAQLEEARNALAELAEEGAALKAAVEARRAPKETPPTEALDRLLDRLSEVLAFQSQQRLESERVLAGRLAIEKALASVVENHEVSLSSSQTSVALQVPTKLFFQQGFTTLSPRGQVLLGEIALAIADLPPLDVAVEGHAAVAKGAQSAWEMAFVHASRVVYALEGKPNLTLSVVSWGSSQAKEGAPEERVVLVFEPTPGLPTEFVPTPEPSPEPEEEAPADDE